MRRRRRRGQGLSPRTLQIAAGAAVVALIGAFFFFLNVADNAEPPDEQIRIELPDAFKN